MQRWIGWAMVAGLASCASPDAKLYTLDVVAPTAVAAPTAVPLVVELRNVSIPGYLDRPEIVRSDAAYRVHLATNERWSEPFGDLLTRVLTADLGRVLPAGTVVFADTSALAARPTHTVQVAIARLDSDGAGQVVLEADVSVQLADRADATPTLRHLRLTEPIDGVSTAGYAAAISTVTAQLAAVTAAMVLALPPQAAS